VLILTTSEDTPPDGTLEHVAEYGAMSASSAKPRIGRKVPIFAERFVAKISSMIPSSPEKRLEVQ